jgi:hypothetical protein
VADSANDLKDLIEGYNDQFFAHCEQRHREGAKEYGDLAFLNNNMIEYILEEIVDLANYARFIYIKVKLMEEIASEGGIDLTSGAVGDVLNEDDVSTMSSAFVPKSEVFGLLQDKE